MTSDDEIVAGAKSGDADAWRVLYRAHAGRLLWWLGRRSHDDGAAAEDVAAESWLTAASKIKDFHGSSEEFAGWLFGIARHQAANHRRQVGRRRTDTSDPSRLVDAAVVAGPEPELAAHDWVERALSALPPRERDVVACVDVLDLGIATTARALGMSPGAVRVARHRGLKRLRVLVGRPADGRPGEPARTAPAS